MQYPCLFLVTVQQYNVSVASSFTQAAVFPWLLTKNTEKNTEFKNSTRNKQCNSAVMVFKVHRILYIRQKYFLVVICIMKFCIVFFVTIHNIFKVSGQQGVSNKVSLMRSRFLY